MLVLKQTGRAGLEFLGSLQHFASSHLRNKAAEDFYQSPDVASLGNAPLGNRPRQELEDILSTAKSVARKSPHYRMERFCQRVVAENVYDRGIPATEAIREQLAPLLAQPVVDGAGTLTLNSALDEPPCFKGVEWHLMPGGWDGYDLSGFMFMVGVGPAIFSRGGYAAVEVDANIGEQRVQVVSELPRRDYRRIYEGGCGGISTLGALRKVFSQAELTGSDLSANLLRFGHLMAGKLRLNVHLKQEDVCATSEPDNHFDAAVSYAVFHEMDDATANRHIKELFRILSPGADLVISDPGPIRGCTPFEAVIYDWETEYREEPWFTDSILRSLPDMLRSAGFVDVEEYALGEGPYPWITRARKPSSPDMKEVT
jgi:SAM-dependent methyltransferase